MERVKNLVIRHFEKILIILIVGAGFLGTYFMEEKRIVLNFYYLPVLVTSYFLGRRMGVLASVLSVLAVLLFALISPEDFFNRQRIWQEIALLSSWGGFLILASVAVGTLYERNERRLVDVKKAYVGILEILSKYLESVDQYMKGHSLRVAEWATEIAIAMELPRAEVENIRVAALLHDIGEIEASGQILSKAAKVTTEEQISTEATLPKGSHLIASVQAVLQEVAPIVLAHHRYYMSTLEKDDKEATRIPLGARVIAVADAFDTMTKDRPHRKGLAPREALEEIASKTGKQFDAEVIKAFKLVFTNKMVQDQPRE